MWEVEQRQHSAVSALDNPVDTVPFKVTCTLQSSALLGQSLWSQSSHRTVQLIDKPQWRFTFTVWQASKRHFMRLFTMSYKVQFHLYKPCEGEHRVNGTLRFLPGNIQQDSRLQFMSCQKPIQASDCFIAARFGIVTPLTPQVTRQPFSLQFDPIWIIVSDCQISFKFFPNSWSFIICNLFRLQAY